MRVLVTGAAGNLGFETISNLLRAGHQVRAFDLPGKHTTRLVRAHGSRVDLFWGDLTRAADVSEALDGVEIIIHNAAVIPPASEQPGDPARRINVDATRLLIDEARQQSTPPRMLLASSIAVFGPRQDKAPPARADDTPLATDHYSTHKLECERMLQDSGLPWLIMRIGAAPPVKAQGGDPALLRFMFEHSLDSRVEFVHPKDVGIAQARAVDVHEAWNRILLIGGGARCQLRNRDLMHRTFEALGIGALPDAAFGSRPLYGDWLDTEESQRLLDYQHHSFEDFLDDLKSTMGVARFGARLIGPFARRALARFSPHYRS